MVQQTDKTLIQAVCTLTTTGNLKNSSLSFFFFLIICFSVHVCTQCDYVWEWDLASKGWGYVLYGEKWYSEWYDGCAMSASRTDLELMN